jgi:hypothetical protein
VPETFQEFPFRSFVETPILFLTVQVRFGLPVLGDERVHAILRAAWLRSAVRDRWFVGHYRVRPDRVSLLVCPDLTARPVTAWTAAWKAISAVRIKQALGGQGRFWELGPPPEPVASAADYEARCAALLPEPTGLDCHRGCPSAGHSGMLWQLLPAGVPDSVPVTAG